MNHPRTIPARFGSNYLRSFREKKSLMRICLNSLFSIFNKNQWRYTLDKKNPTEYILKRPNYAPTVQIGANSGFKYRCLCPSKNFLFSEMAPILDGSERVIAFNAKLPIFQLYHRENYKLHLITDTDTRDRIAIPPVPPSLFPKLRKTCIVSFSY